MPAIERIARATRAPADVVRAAAQCASALLAPPGSEAGARQLASAVSRLVLAAVRAGAPAPEALALLLS